MRCHQSTYLSLLLSSLVPSLRARPSLDPPTRRRGSAHHERARGACDARRARRVGVRAPCALGVCGPCSRETAVLGSPLLHARYSLHSVPRDRRRAGRAHHERARDVRGARCGAPGVRGRQGKSAFLCRGSRFARVLCLSLLSLLRAALLPRSPPRKRACASGHTTHARSESRVGAALRVCLWFICASFRDLARRAARSCALVLLRPKTRKPCFIPLVRRLLAGLGGPWRSKQYTKTTTGLPYVAVRCAKCEFL